MTNDVEVDLVITSKAGLKNTDAGATGPLTVDTAGLPVIGVEVVDLWIIGAAGLQVVDVEVVGTMNVIAP